MVEDGNWLTIDAWTVLSVRVDFALHVVVESSLAMLRTLSTDVTVFG
jgi:hypothetical protein